MENPPLPSFLQIPGRSTKSPLMPYGTTLLWAGIIGILGGCIATVYYWILSGGLYVVWDLVHPALSAALHFAWSDQVALVLLTVGGGTIVGLSVYWLCSPGEISAVVNNIHIKRGRMDYKENPAMAINSLVSIIFGGSAGPEAPLVQLIGSNGSKLGEKLHLHGDLIRTFTFCGMAAALGAFFGAPIGGALFALEIPHNRGLEYYEALIPSVISALTSFMVFRTFIGYDGALYHLPQLSNLSMSAIFKGALMGIIGGGIAVIFIYLFRKIEDLLAPLSNRPILLAALGGLSIGVIAAFFPADFVTTPLFWSEYEIVDLLDGITALQTSYSVWGVVGLLALLMLAKMLSIGFTLHSGLRGGFIFPLFFIGAAAGIAISMVTNQYIPFSISIIGLMAAVNVGVTKTPISTSVILISLTGGSLFPVVAVASLGSYICTERVRLIRTQQHRKDNPSPMHRVWRWKED